jgi:hypothetical protein
MNTDPFLDQPTVLRQNSLNWDWRRQSRFIRQRYIYESNLEFNFYTFVGIAMAGHALYTGAGIGDWPIALGSNV